MGAIEMLNWAYARLMEGADEKRRKYVNALLEGRVGPDGGIIVDDPNLPASLQGQQAPSWWDSDYDPMSDTFTVPS